MPQRKVGVGRILLPTQLEQLTRDNLEACTVRCIHRGRNKTKAVVLLVDVGGRAFIVKDIRPRNVMVRRLFGRQMLRREFDVLRQLDDLTGVPRAHKMLDEDAFVMDYVEGTNIGSLDDVSDATMQRLCALFEELHRRGVAHGDPHASNILIAPGGDCFLIDFNTAFVNTASSPDEEEPGWRERLWLEMQQQDLRRLAKMKQRFTPHLLTEEDKRLLEDPSRLYRFSKNVRAGVGMVRWKFWRKRWKRWRKRRLKKKLSQEVST